MATAEGTAKIGIGAGVIGLVDNVLRPLLLSGRTDLVVIGAPRPKGAPGLRSRMYPEKLTGVLAAPPRHRRHRLRSGRS